MPRTKPFTIIHVGVDKAQNEEWLALAHARHLTLAGAVRLGLDRLLKGEAEARCPTCDVPYGLLDDVTDVDPAFGHWFAGFVDGEGCFRITENNGGRSMTCRFAINLRDDDAPILREIHSTLKMGTLNRDASQGTHRTSQPRMRWQVYDKSGCMRLVAIFDRFPLRAKKGRDYAIWREAVLQWGQAGGPRSGYAGPANWEPMRQLQAELVATRAYEAGT